MGHDHDDSEHDELEGDEEPEVEDLDDDPAYNPEDEGLKGIKGG
ncbi:MAG: hypothetical protein NVSMB25_00530 [Thermoleophilaceae bacterium]